MTDFLVLSAPMKIPITKYGMPQVAFFTADLVGLMALGFIYIPNLIALIIVEIILFLLLAWVLAFFRDPKRQIPNGTDILISPADGMISDIEEVDDETIPGKKLLRIGIFLNIFNVHINRTPCRVKIDNIQYRPGAFKNAMNADCGKVNESNDITMTRLDEPQDKLIVRQISGAIARRIVCKASIGDEFAGGQQFGMIKFGSRTELYLPTDSGTVCQVSVGEKVKAGNTILVKYETNE